MQLGRLHRHLELVHQVKGQVAAQAGGVEKFGEHQHQQQGIGQRQCASRVLLRGRLDSPALPVPCLSGL